MKKITNLFILALILLTTFIYPINKDIFKIDLSREKHEQNLQEMQEQDKKLFKILALNEEKYIVNPNRFELKIVDLQENDISFSQEYLKNAKCELSVFDFSPSGEQREIQPKTAKEIEINLDESSITSASAILWLDLKKENLNLENGQYRFKLKIDLDSSKFEHQFSAMYLPTEFKKHVSEYPKNSMICHYFTQDKEHIVPLFVPITWGKNEYRTMLETMNYESPIEGISNEEKLPWAFNIWYSNGKLDIKFNKSSLQTLENKRINPLAIQLLVENYAQIKGLNIVNNINIHEYADEERITSYDVNRAPRIYSPLLINDRNELLFTYKNINEFESMDDFAAEFMMRMKNLMNDKDIITLLPQNIDLKSVNMVGNTIKLEFEPGLKEFFHRKEAKGLAQLFVDCVALSFTTIDDADNVEILINGSKINKLGDYSFDESITRPEFYN